MFHRMAVVSSTLCALTFLGFTCLYHLHPTTARAATNPPTNDTVLLVCTYDQSTSPNTMVPVVFDKSANAPPATSNTCAQIISGYIVAGFRIQSESLEMPNNWAHFHLTRP